MELVRTDVKFQWLSVDRLLKQDGYETISIDMPTYGVSEVASEKTISYDDWVQCGSDLIDAELAKGSRPIFLYVLAGGMETIMLPHVIKS